MMIPTSTSTPSSLPVSQDTAQPPADPVVKCRERVAMTVLEVFEPAPQRPVDVGDDGLKTVPVGAPGLATHRVLELLQALRTRPTRTRLEVIPQEVKAARLGGVHDPRLGRVERREVDVPGRTAASIPPPSAFGLCRLRTRFEVDGADSAGLDAGSG